MAHYTGGQGLRYYNTKLNEEELQLLKSLVSRALDNIATTQIRLDGFDNLAQRRTVHRDLYVKLKEMEEDLQ